MASADAEPGSAVPDGDLLQWGFRTLVESYDRYHGQGSDGSKSRPLRKFAYQLPPAPALQARGVEDEARQAQQRRGEQRTGGSSSASGCSRGELSAKPKKPERRPVEAPPPAAAGPATAPRTGALAARGPMPKAFAGFDAASDGRSKHAHGAGTVSSVEGADGNQASPEEWKEYFSQCAEYYRQCETAAAAQCSMPAAAATAPPSQPHASTFGCTPWPGSAPGQLPAGLPYAGLGMMNHSGVPMPAVAGGYCHGASPPAMPMPAALPTMGGIASQVPAGMDDGLANLLMAWYMSGYHTGLYAARQGK
eukprot:gnl/TRDRNA2_/TRDRNA2_191174_c0_seq1.p1 gnl/TRDRNA2_/TRDRNA2_191174_c0~~gnl/TRDRNA2_/TRDRNA2_191174_c0_seq1.p1  ORF type:complete len:307 (+),score=53.50 gnl/TRDRNA2_/TRDRNA2_191174_c0_seq1:99-1019(+)